ncbi:hypothetical protein BIV57_04605 [Mangrovactinospora gilvigrisea]|uniref:Lsr2 family protein n=1 Tax=Mangrovactinospora gilvigrisea TaxID=1428644 RepID=A0A1J7BYW4_9ACTN|nr:Lsr2 family protein [Mangrovactinospora gilvigrisea]OIV38673.1 hypothetical protein BIV57_04605 [Mangrovactinospora gilvigrisea]
MAQRVAITLIDDLDGGQAAETVQFSVDGRSYEIDLSSGHADELRTALAPYINAGRRQSRSGRSFTRTAVRPDPGTLRAWARAQGIEVPPRGRIPQRVYDAFAGTD